MNLLYCGDANITDGLIISILSLLKNVQEELNIFVLTLDMQYKSKICKPVGKPVIDRLGEKMKHVNANNVIHLIDMTELFERNIPSANMNTLFTPCCMLRLFADCVPELPDRLLYLDYDVICRKDLSAFYHQDLHDTEMVGVLDHFGKWFFRKNILHQDYLNSGVLLLNMSKIKQTRLFQRSRAMCACKKMFMPDQSALNSLSETKRVAERKYNEQYKLREDTVLQHFSTSFRLLPFPHKLTVKPWQIGRVHQKLKLHEYDDILREYAEFIKVIN